MVNSKHGLNDFGSGEGCQTFQILLIENGIKELHDSYYRFDIHKMTRETERSVNDCFRLNESFFSQKNYI